MTAINMTDAIADRFAMTLLRWLTPAQFVEMKRDNETDPLYSDGFACASHNYCDANEAMAEAFRAVTHRDPDPASEADAALWNAAWERARVRHIGSQVIE